MDHEKAFDRVVFIEKSGRDKILKSVSLKIIQVCGCYWNIFEHMQYILYDSKSCIKVAMLKISAYAILSVSF